MNTRIALLSAALALGAAACEKERDEAASSDPFAVTRAAWEQAELEVSALAPVEEGALPGSESCRSGVVSGVHVLICEYPDAEAAEESEEQGLARVGDGTGLSIARDRLLLVLVDSDEVDPSGKTINSIGTTFRDLEVPPRAGEDQDEKASAKPQGS